MKSDPGERVSRSSAGRDALISGLSSLIAVDMEAVHEEFSTLCFEIFLFRDINKLMK
jgi:hypothetical protein